MKRFITLALMLVGLLVVGVIIWYINTQIPYRVIYR